MIDSEDATDASVLMQIMMDSTTFLSSIRLKSCSRKKFATNSVRAVFAEHERPTSNVNGRNNKKTLDPKKIKAIKEATFHSIPRQ